MKRELINQEFDRLRFRYPWRDYQAAALADLQSHLADQRLHLVAPPGAGKTVLGLEVMRRLREPALIIVPTLSILTQWEDSLRHRFEAGDVTWISRDLAKPGLVTITTYQGLFAAAKGSGVPGVAGVLSAAGVKTVLMDEAHHLRNEWWRVLNALLQQLPVDHRVALTGTPPYDVDRAEWARYRELCGEIDVEITVPELVQSGDLCPHADFVWIEPPRPEIKAKLAKNHQDLTAFWSMLPAEDRLAAWVHSLPELNFPLDHSDSIFASPRPLIAAMVLLATRGEDVPAQALALFSAEPQELPPWSEEWAEELLNRLFSENSDHDPHGEIRQTLSKRVRQLGVLHHGKVRLSISVQADREITSSAGKLNGVERIVTETLRRKADAARIVVLSSSIHREVLPATRASPTESDQVSKLGVAPCFEVLRRSGVRSLGLLTGTLLVIPRDVESELNLLHQELFPGDPPLPFRRLSGDDAFVTCGVPDRLRHRVVAWTTLLFTQGHIQVLCGTQSLLGEGWDAPCINCLVIASNSGSFMLSNQIRGRAVRRDQNDPLKTSAIWHLATATGIHSFEPDFDTLERRFDMFVGPHVDEPTIVSGLERVGDVRRLELSRLSNFNEHQLERAGDAEWIRSQWVSPDRITTARPPQMQREVRLNRPVDPRFFSTFAIESILRLTIGTTIYGMFQTLAESFRGMRSNEELPWRLTIWALLCLIFFGPSNVKALWLILRFGKTSPVTRVIAEACFKQLFPPEHVLDARDPLQLRESQTDYGISFTLSGGLRIERLRLSAALRECFGPIDSPRFLLRIGRRVAWFPIRSPLYFPLPSEIRKRDQAAEFVHRIGNRLGGAALVDCRTAEGRAELLRARKADLFRSVTSDPPRELSRWE